MTEIRRVPLDFDWPSNKVWDGFLRPDKYSETPCPACGGTGETPGGLWLRTYVFRLLMLADHVENPRSETLHPWLNDDPYPPIDRNQPPLWQRGMMVDYPRVMPDQTNVALANALSPDRRTGPFGYSSTDAYVGADRIRDALGLPEGWSLCPTCEGDGSTEAYEGQRAEAEAWTPTPPPTGDGWQAWEDVSEGSPISPVFATRDGLVEWFTTPASIWGARQHPLTREQAEALVNAGGSIGSFISVSTPEGTRMIDGDSAVHDLHTL